MAKLFNRAKMTTSTTGSGTVTLSAAANGFQSFADAGVSDGDVIQYVIEEGNAWEIGTGAYSATGTSLTRTPSESSDGGSAITLGGTAKVSITTVASQIGGGDRNLSFDDDAKAIFGAGSDLEIYHNSTAGENIIDANSGTLVLRSPGAGTIEFRDQSSQVLAQFNDNSDVKLYYNNNEKLATTSTGVDITGTLTSDGLTVDGTALMSTTNELQFYTSAYGIRASTGLEIKTGDFTRFLNGATELMRITSSGSVGIGTSSPSEKITIQSGNLNFSGGTNDAQYIKFGDTDDADIGNIFYYHGNNNMVFTTNASEAMRITSSGSVGIGTSSPSSNLHVEGGAGANIGIKSTAGRHWRIGDGVGSTDGYFVIYDYTGSTARLTIDTSGTVTMGTANVSALDFGNWTVVESSGVLYFATGGVNKMKLDASGNLTVTGNVTAYGTV